MQFKNVFDFMLIGQTFEFFDYNGFLKLKRVLHY